MNHCRYCKTPLPPKEYHPTAKICRSEACQAQKQEERKGRKWGENKVKYGPYRCRECNKRLPLNGNRFFCDTEENYCQNRYQGNQRVDGDWIYAIPPRWARVRLWE